MSVKTDLNELVRKWLENKLGYEIEKAELDDYMSAWEIGGCETCGGGIDKDFNIIYWTADSDRSHYLNVEGDPLSWLAYTLLNFEDELNRLEDSRN
jgi:hypothetical protein